MAQTWLVVRVVEVQPDKQEPELEVDVSLYWQDEFVVSVPALLHDGLTL